MITQKSTKAAEKWKIKNYFFCQLVLVEAQNISEEKLQIRLTIFRVHLLVYGVDFWVPHTVQSGADFFCFSVFFCFFCKIRQISIVKNNYFSSSAKMVIDEGKNKMDDSILTRMKGKFWKVFSACWNDISQVGTIDSKADKPKSLSWTSPQTNLLSIWIVFHCLLNCF